MQLTPQATGWCVELPGVPSIMMLHAAWRDEARTVLQAECDGMVESIVLARQDGMVHLFHAGRAWCFDRADARRQRVEERGGGAVLAPLTARVMAVMVREGDTVAAGQGVVVLEAMKMEHTLTAPRAGRVAQLSAQAGGQAAKGAILLRIEEHA